jgi:gamma-glutamyltranspeptidase/glutathione hydrolase
VKRAVRTRYGTRGAIAAGHPLAAAAGIQLLATGGNAIDATIAAQAVLSVVMPDACGLGGDALLLVRDANGELTALNGCGAAGAAAVGVATDGGASVTVPGIVRAWDDAHRLWGRAPLDTVLQPAVEVAELGHRVGEPLALAARSHADRLRRGGGQGWVDELSDPRARALHPALAAVLRSIAREGPDTFYHGPLAAAIQNAVRRSGGALTLADLATHRSVIAPPIEIRWAGRPLWVQPPPSQAVLLAIGLRWLDLNPQRSARSLDHVSVELTEAAFGLRDRVEEGVALLDSELAVDVGQAHRRGGPRGSLHTAAVAASDTTGLTVSSLVSVFDDFGSAVFVPEGGFVLNNRAGGFTSAPNDFAPAKRPVHTLTPIMLETARGPLALATPGADGQVQTLLQVVGAMRFRRRSLADAIGDPRWRSEAGRLLIERGYRHRRALVRLGHDLVVVEDGDSRMGAVVGAGSEDGIPMAVGDWRREVAAGVT